MNLEKIEIENKVESEEERFKRLRDNTYKEARRLEDPEFYYPLIKLKGELEEIKANDEFGGFKDEKERATIARHFDSLLPNIFYLLDGIIYVYDGYSVEMPDDWNKRQKDLEKRNDWEYYN